jgi:hypothetical protein
VATFALTTKLTLVEGSCSIAEFVTPVCLLEVVATAASALCDEARSEARVSATRTSERAGLEALFRMPDVFEGVIDITLTN